MHGSFGGFLLAICLLQFASTSTFSQVDSSSLIETISGGPSGYEGDGDLASAGRYRFNDYLTIHALTLGWSGNLLITDTENNRIRQISQNGILSTIAGSGNWGFEGDGGLALASSLAQPGCVTVDAQGRIYIADTRNSRVRRINDNGTIQTIVGGGSIRPSQLIFLLQLREVSALELTLDVVRGIAIDPQGYLYVHNSSQGAQTYFRVSPSGMVEAKGIADIAAFDAEGNSYYAIGDQIYRNQVVYAGTGESGFSGDGGPALAAQFSGIGQIALDRLGNLFIADTNNRRIRQVSTTGIVTTIVGTGQYARGNAEDGDGGQASGARLGMVNGLVVDNLGNLYFSETVGGALDQIHLIQVIERIRKVTTKNISLAPDFAWTPSSPSIGQTIQFTDNSIGLPTTWLWEFGDGMTSALQNPSHIYTGSGTMKVKLTVSDAFGAKIITKYVAVLSPPGEKFILGNVNPDLPTIVLTHGLQSGPYSEEKALNLWTGSGYNQASTLIRDSFGANSNKYNVVQYIWKDGFQGSAGLNWSDYKEAQSKTSDAAARLAHLLTMGLGENYNKPIHFIGHSLGTVVNAYAAKQIFKNLQHVTEAQFTALDRPHHVSKIFDLDVLIDPLHSIDEWMNDRLYGYDENFFACVLPISHISDTDLRLSIDNYYSLTGAGVGDKANGPIYNHELRHPYKVGDHFFPDESDYIVIDNDHSGVQQWYRWTILSNPNDLNSSPICSENPFSESTLNPCQEGWYWSINNHYHAFPKVESTPRQVTTASIRVTNPRSFGCTIYAEGSQTSIRCSEASSPYLLADAEVPIDAEYIWFDYQLDSAGDGDYAAVLFDDVPIWILSGTSAEPGKLLTAGPIPIAGLQGKRKLTVALFGVGEHNFGFRIQNFRADSFVRNYFAQVAVGNGYSTTFALLNIGAETSSGNLILAGDNGMPLQVSFESPGQIDAIGSSFPINVPPGGMQFIKASSVTPGGPTISGWARAESSGGHLKGSAGFQVIKNDNLQNLAGVLSADATNVAMIAVDDNMTLGIHSYATGYAVANSGDEDVYIRITVYSSDGSIWKTFDPPSLNPLKSGNHTVGFLWQDINDPNLQFRGSMVLAAREAKTFSVVGMIMNQGITTAFPVITTELVNSAQTANVFPQVAVGNGYSTTFALLNIGAETSSGNLILTDSKGTPLRVSFESPGQIGAIGTSYPINVPPAGIQLIKASSVSPGDPTISGWARSESSGGHLKGLATFQVIKEDNLQNIAGALSADATNAATIAVDDNMAIGDHSYATGYAVANPGDEDVNIRITVYKSDGSIWKIIDPPSLNPLKSGNHTVGFLWQDINDPSLQFMGSMVLAAREGKTFAIVGVIMNQGISTAFPVIPANLAGRRPDRDSMPSNRGRRSRTSQSGMPRFR